MNAPSPHASGGKAHQKKRKVKVGRKEKFNHWLHTSLIPSHRANCHMITLKVSLLHTQTFSSSSSVSSSMTIVSPILREIGASSSRVRSIGVDKSRSNTVDTSLLTVCSRLTCGRETQQILASKEMTNFNNLLEDYVQLVKFVALLLFFLMLFDLRSGCRHSLLPAFHPASNPLLRASHGEDI